MEHRAPVTEAAGFILVSEDFQSELTLGDRLLAVLSNRAIPLCQNGNEEGFSELTTKCLSKKTPSCATPSR